MGEYMGTHRLATQRTRVIMKFFVLLSATVAAATAQYPVAYAAGLGYAPHAAYGAYGVAPAAYHGVAAAYHAAAPLAAVAPAVAPVAPVAAVAPIAPEVTSSQYRAEDEAGNTAYGYQNINNAAEQRGTANSNGVTGSYSYVDEAGHHSVSYVADDFGYRVIGRTRRSAQVAPVAYAGLPHHLAVAPAAYADVAPAAVAAAPAAPARDAVLTTIKLNPGHAVFYRVD